MEWFCKKDQVVPEGGPIQFKFFFQHRVSHGFPLMDTMAIYTDDISQTAPEQANKNVKIMATLKANLTKIPESHRAKLIQKKDDGEDYYVFDACIEANFSSANVKYTMVVGDERYDTVTCQYA